VFALFSLIVIAGIGEEVVTSKLGDVFQNTTAYARDLEPAM